MDTGSPHIGSFYAGETSTSTPCAGPKASLRSVCTSIVLYSRTLLTYLRCVEVQQKEVKLEEDDTEALKAVIQSIYGIRLKPYNERSWRYWLNLTTVADKYLERALSKQAYANLV